MTRSALLIATICIPLISSCLHKDVEPTPVNFSTASPTETVKATPANPADLEAIRKFAESYQPKSGRVVIPEVPELDDKLLKILSGFSASGSREHEKYIILIFLRISNFHRDHFKQSYELGRTNPLMRRLSSTRPIW